VTDLHFVKTVCGSVEFVAESMSHMRFVKTARACPDFFTECRSDQAAAPVERPFDGKSGSALAFAADGLPRTPGDTSAGRFPICREMVFETGRARDGTKVIHRRERRAEA